MKLVSRILGIMILVGLILAVIGFFMGLDASNLSAFFNDSEAYGDMITETHEEVITTLEVDVDTRSIVISYVDEAVLTVTYYKHETRDTWTIDGSNAGIFRIEQDERPQFFNFKFVPEALRTVHIYIPNTWVIDMLIETATGQVRLENEAEIEVRSLELISHTGSIYMKNLLATTISAHTDTGSVMLTNAGVENVISLGSNTGSVHLTNVVGGPISIDTDTGSAYLTDVRGEGLIIDVDTGKIQILRALFAGNVMLESKTGSVNLTQVQATSFDIKSATGDVRITFEELSNYRYDLKTSTGKIRVDGVNQGNRHTTTTGDILVKISVDTGDITISK